MDIKSPIGQYLTVTLSYWAFTLTDGALRMLVVLYFHQLGYSPLEVAMLFLLYEFFGIVTNLVGGWLGARLGLNITMHLGLALQIVALGMLLVDTSWLSVVYVMIAQALSGIAKDLNKMSAKSSIKTLIPANNDQGKNKLYRWVSLLTGSKNTLKGVGFFLGGLLLAVFGFQGAILWMLVGLVLILIASVLLLDKNLGKTSFKPKFKDILSKSEPINRLSAARFFLFGSRDVWFVVALPVFLQTQLNWNYTQVGTLMALWVIAYGFVQSAAPWLTRHLFGKTPDGRSVLILALALCLLPLGIIFAFSQGWDLNYSLVIGLLIFGAVFAVNSSVHSYLIVAYSKQDGVSLDVGFYYMANAGGRLLGTLLSGWVFQVWGLGACLWISSLLIVLAAIASLKLPTEKNYKKNEAPQG